jgi:cell division topological specificity factor
MNILRLWAPRASARQAHERLQALLAYERASAGRADLVAILRREILAAIARHIPVDRDKVVVRLDPGEEGSILAIDIELPQRALAAR